MDSTRHDSISTIIERQPLQYLMQKIIYQKHFPALFNSLLSSLVQADLAQSEGAKQYQAFYQSNVQEYVGGLCERVMTIFRADLIQQINALEREYEKIRDRVPDELIEVRDQKQKIKRRQLSPVGSKANSFRMKLPKSGRRLQFSNNQSENLSKRRMKHMKSAELKRDWRKQEQKGRSKPKKFKK